MSVREAKAIYESLVESGEIEFMFPQVIGDWTQDKKSFLELYNKNLEMLFSELDIDDSEDDFYEQL